MKLKTFRFSDKTSLKENNLEPVEIDSVFCSHLTPNGLSQKVKIHWFDAALSNGYLIFSVDNCVTNMLVKKIDNVPIGNRQDFAKDETFRNIIFEEPDTDPFTSGDFRSLKFKGEITTGKETDFIECPHGKFWFDSVLRGNYSEVPARDGLSRPDLIFTLVIYKTEENDNQLLLLEIAHPGVLEGGLITLFLARSIHAHEIEQL